MTTAPARVSFLDGPRAAVAMVLLGVLLRLGAYCFAGGLTSWEARPVAYHTLGKDPASLPAPVRWALAFAGDGPAEDGRLLSLFAALGGLVAGAFLVARLCPGRWRLLGLLLLALAPTSVLDAARLSPRAAIGLLGGLAVLAALPRADGSAPSRIALAALAIVGAVAGWVSFHGILPLAGVAVYWIVRGLKEGWREGIGATVAVLGGILLLSLFIGGPSGIPDPGLPPDTTGWPPYLPGIDETVTKQFDGHTSYWANLSARGMGVGSALLLGAAVLAGVLSSMAGSVSRIAAVAWLAVAWGAAWIDPAGAPMAHPAGIPLIAGLAAAGCGSLDVRGGSCRGAGLRFALAAGLVVPAAIAVGTLERRALLGCDMVPLLKDLSERVFPGDRVLFQSEANSVVRLALLRVPEFPESVPLITLRDEGPSVRLPGLGAGAAPSRVWLVFAGEHPDGASKPSPIFRTYARRADLLETLRRPGASAYLFRAGAP